jgi:hypothetical protein
VKHTSDNHFIVIGSLEEVNPDTYETRNKETKKLCRFLVKSTKEDDDEQTSACFVEFTTFKASHMAKLDCTEIGAEVTVKGYLESRPGKDGGRMFTGTNVTSLVTPGTVPPATGRASDSLSFAGALDKDPDADKMDSDPWIAYKP